MPDEAELTDVAGGGKDPVGDWVTANLLEELVGASIECVNGGAERSLAGNVAERWVGNRFRRCVCYRHQDSRLTGIGASNAS